MKKKWIGSVICAVVLICLVGVMAACSSPTPTPTAVPTATAKPLVTPLPAPTATSAVPMDGAAIVSARCTTCHTLERVTSSKKTSDQWTQTVNRMVPYLSGTTEQTVLLDYLAKTYGP